MDSLLVPSSIQRIRSFLVESCGMKVKPWASTEETLGALAATLVARRGCDRFWASLRELLETLARDLKTRQQSDAGSLVDNEVLDEPRFEALLEELRAALAGQDEGATSFRRIAAAVSAPALALLLLLGGAATAGCDSRALGTTNKADTALVADVRPDAHADAAADAGSDAQSIVIHIPDAPTWPDTGPVSDGSAPAPDGALVTIDDIMAACNLPPRTQEEVRACLLRLRESWRTGVAEALAGAPCDYVAGELSCFAYGQACYRGTADEFVVGSTRICTAIPIYIGVRFV